MNTNEFDYDLPNELIAQTPLINRSTSRLLVVDKATGEYLDKKFTDVTKYLKKGDTLVLNNTKVLPARLIGIKEETGAVIEILLLQNTEGNVWKCLAKPQKRLSVGTIVNFEDLLSLKVMEKCDEGIVYVEFSYEGIFNEILDKLGSMPLPPYIHEKLEDKDRYQTVYAKEVGSSAAPTAGLHFTKELLEDIKNIGVNIVYVTLHVGLGTFRPVEVDDVTNHKMHSEYYFMSKDSADVLNATKKSGGNIYAVGTTSVRTLETVITKYGEFKECSGETDIFIYPGYTIKSVDGLITNFHLPKSTLIMLVSALSSKENIMKAYKHAVTDDYRFFSFGDAMFIK